jgi:hypothetical protein
VQRRSNACLGFCLPSLHGKPVEQWPQVPRALLQNICHEDPLQATYSDAGSQTTLSSAMAKSRRQLAMKTQPTPFGQCSAGKEELMRISYLGHIGWLQIRQHPLWRLPIQWQPHWKIAFRTMISNQSQNQPQLLVFKTVRYYHDFQNSDTNPTPRNKGSRAFKSQERIKAALQKCFKHIYIYIYIYIWFPNTSWNLPAYEFYAIVWLLCVLICFQTMQT